MQAEQRHKTSQRVSSCGLVTRASSIPPLMSPQGSSPVSMAKSKGTSARIAGWLLKQSPSIFVRWQLRYCEIQSGKLIWWQDEAKASAQQPAKNQLHLSGMRVKKQSDSRFTVSTPSGKKTYILDADVSRYTRNSSHSLKSWVEALEQESVLARRKESADFDTENRRATIN